MQHMNGLALSRAPDQRGVFQRTQGKWLLASIGAVLFALCSASFADAAKPEFANAEQFGSAISFPGNTIFKTVAGTEVKCTGGGIETATIVAAGSKKAKSVQFNLKGCKGEGVECKTAGAAAGEIRSKTLEGELGYVKPAVEGAETVVFALFPAVGETIAAYACTAAYEQKGCIGGEIKKANELTQSWTLLFEETNGVQSIKVFEPTKGGAPAKCETKVKIGTAEEQDGMEDSQTIALPCPNMIKS
jgi:hypothetical protein